VNGMLGCLAWIATASMHPVVGRWLDRTKDYTSVVAFAGLVPLIGFLALILLWKEPTARSEDSTPQDPVAEAVGRRDRL
jgi:hypothetical protein